MKAENLNERLRVCVTIIMSRMNFKTQTQLSNLLGYTNSGFSQIVNGIQPISLRFLNKFLLIFPFISRDYLIYGEGSPIDDENEQDITLTDIISKDMQAQNDTQIQKSVSDMQMSNTALSLQIAQLAETNQQLVKTNEQLIDTVKMLVQEYTKCNELLKLKVENA